MELKQEPEYEYTLKGENARLRAALADLVEAIELSDVGFEDFVLQSMFRARDLVKPIHP